MKKNIYLCNQNKNTMTTVDISTKFLGIDIPSPIISGSCGLTSKIENLVEMEKNGVGAVILKSLFEEQITFDIQKNTGFLSNFDYSESYDYISNHVEGFEIDKYLKLISEAKKVLSIPVVASINCVTYSNWITYAKKLQEAGADAIEINFMVLPFSPNTSCEDIETLFDDVILALRRTISIPIIIKLGKYFTDMSKFMHKLSWSGIKGITLFNKTINFDIDTEKEDMKHTSIISNETALYDTLRWTALLSGKIRCEISASSGILTGNDVIKTLLVGAQTTQVVSTLYSNGIEHIKTMNDYLKNWMTQKGYNCLNDFRGKLRVKDIENSNFTRIQFMKHYAEIE
ncbi:MAG: dihydroorotate dehydrogenase-like protein [Bacteroidales bacterium]|nr:dihydroorotate dehydrogenase-like protein [Bacteroidales bacterium]